jgi:putative iron-regulated protein
MLRKSLTITIFSLAIFSQAGCAGQPGNDSESAGGAGTASTLDPEQKRAVVRAYADIAFANYRDTQATVVELDSAIDAFLADPTEATLQTAMDRWVVARLRYTPTEVFRFYDGPIDNAVDGPEGRINAWPLDEAYIDYVQGDPNAGVINMTALYPEITEDVLVELNERDGEENISTGFHAIEFLLWGQDLSADGPGARPASDFSVGQEPSVERRRQYLQLVSDLLVADIGQVAEAWDPEGEANYRAEFLAADPDLALQKILTGMGILSGHELAGERMSVAYETKDQEDEHSCFSDTTLADLAGNAEGIRMVYLGEYGDVAGPGIAALVAAVDPALDARLRSQLDASVAAIAAIPAPFDQQITAADDAPGRQAILAAIEALEAQTATLAEAAAMLGLTGNAG